MEEDIKINATIDPAALRFKLAIDRPIYNGSVYFSSKDTAKGAPLAEKIFQVSEVKGVRVSGNEVSVNVNQEVDWKAKAKEVAAVVRAQIRAGEDCVPAGFRFSTISDQEMKAVVQELFDSQINPSVAQHGGFVELVDVKEGRVYLRMGGGCQGCASSLMTLKQGIEGSIREQLPQVVDILDVTDHAGGANPYYS